MFQPYAQDSSIEHWVISSFTYHVFNDIFIVQFIINFIVMKPDFSAISLIPKTSMKITSYQPYEIVTSTATSIIVSDMTIGSTFHQ